MNQEAQLASLLKGGTKTNVEGSFLATVTAASVETIDVVAGDGTEYFDVQLKAAIGINKSTGEMIIMPIIGSTVLVNSIEGSNRLYVAMFSEIDTVTFNKGEYGMVKIDKLTEELNKLVKVFRNHVHDGVITEVTGNATGTPGSTKPPTSSIGDFDHTIYQDEKIRH